MTTRTDEQVSGLARALAMLTRYVRLRSKAAGKTQEKITPPKPVRRTIVFFEMP